MRINLILTLIALFIADLIGYFIYDIGIKITLVSNIILLSGYLLGVLDNFKKRKTNK